MVFNLIDITSPPILVSEDSHQTTDISEPKKFTEDLQNMGTNLGLIYPVLIKIIMPASYG